MFVHLARGEQRRPVYLSKNPQGLAPALELDDGTVLTQSLAIIEYLDALAPQPRLVPADPLLAAKVRGVALAIACDIHPLNNRRVLDYLRGRLGQSDEAVDRLGPPLGAERRAGGGRAPRRARPLLLRRASRRSPMSASFRSCSPRAASRRRSPDCRSCWRSRRIALAHPAFAAARCSRTRSDRARDRANDRIACSGAFRQKRPGGAQGRRGWAARRDSKRRAEAFPHDRADGVLAREPKQHPGAALASREPLGSSVRDWRARPRPIAPASPRGEKSARRRALALQHSPDRRRICLLDAGNSVRILRVLSAKISQGAASGLRSRSTSRSRSSAKPG